MAWKHLHSSDPRKPAAKAALLKAAGLVSGRVTLVKVDSLTHPLMVQGDVLESVSEQQKAGHKRRTHWKNLGTFTAKLPSETVTCDGETLGTVEELREQQAALDPMKTKVWLPASEMGKEVSDNGEAEAKRERLAFLARESLYCALGKNERKELAELAIWLLDQTAGQWMENKA